MPLDSRKKVCIVGFCATSRDLAPYDDPEWETWGLNRAYLFQPRADRWFDLHSPYIVASQQRRPGRHIEWLRAFNGPVYVHARHEALGDNQVVYPLAEVAADLFPHVHRVGKSKAACGAGGCTHPPLPSSGDPAGRCPCACHQTDAEWDQTGHPYITSSIAFEIALAIHEGFETIMLAGVSLNTASEYAWQRPGVEFLLGLAAGRGITVINPDVEPLLSGTLYGRGFLSPQGEEFSYTQLDERSKALQHDHQAIQQEQARLQGAHRELVYLSQQLIPGTDPEKLQTQRTDLEAKLRSLSAQEVSLEGARSETERYLRVRVAALREQVRRSGLEVARQTGALQALATVQAQLAPGIDHECSEDRRKAMEGNLAALQSQLLQTQGALQETAYWLHQTLAGQDPGEAIWQLLDQGPDGPLTDLAVLQSPDPALAAPVIDPAPAVGAD